jgi:hypothetical protein
MIDNIEPVLIEMDHLILLVLIRPVHNTLAPQSLDLLFKLIANFNFESFGVHIFALLDLELKNIVDSYSFQFSMLDFIEGKFLEITELQVILVFKPQLGFQRLRKRIKQ